MVPFRSEDRFIVLSVSGILCLPADVKMYSAPYSSMYSFGTWQEHFLSSNGGGSMSESSSSYSSSDFGVVFSINGGPSLTLAGPREGGNVPSKIGGPFPVGDGMAPPIPTPPTGGLFPRGPAPPRRR